MFTRLVSHPRLRHTASNVADLNPNASDSQILRAGHWCVAGFAVFMAAFATMLHGVKIDLGFIYVSQSLLTFPKIS